MVWIKIRTDRMSVLIWVQTVSKAYQQTTKVAARKERVRMPTIYVLFEIDSGQEHKVLVFCMHL